MITYEEQKKMIAELKQRPDIKKLTKTATVLFVLGGLLAIVGIGVCLLIAGIGVLKKRDSRIDQIIVMETAKGKETNQEKMRNVPVNVAVAKEVAEAEKKKERVEELVRAIKHHDKLFILLWLSLLLAWVFTLLFPIAKFSLLGVDIVKINVLDLLKDEGGLFSGYAQESSTGGILPKYLFFASGAIFLILVIEYCVLCLLQYTEKNIRKVNGEVILSSKKKKNTAKMQIMTGIILIPPLVFCFLYLPISWLKYAKDTVSVNVFGLIVIGAMALVSIFMFIVWLSYTIRERKNLDIAFACNAKR